MENQENCLRLELRAARAARARERVSGASGASYARREVGLVRGKDARLAKL